MTPEERAWKVVRRAYEERPPHAPRRRARWVAAAVAAVCVVVVLAVVSPPGHAVFERVREALGVQHAAPALLSLPGGGRLLVQSAEGGGTWIVQADGARRRLGSWQDAGWSPHGLYLVVADRDGLSAIDPEGRVRWTLPRSGVSSPSWEGTLTDTRIAYFARSGLRVVAGDGTGDRLLERYADDYGPPAWDPGRLHTLAYESGGAVVLREVDSGRVVWRKPVRLEGRLAWSSDGRRLAVVAGHRITVLDARGRQRRWIGTSAGWIRDAAFRPGAHELAVSLRYPGGGGRRSEVRLVDVDHPASTRLLFAGPGSFGDSAWSPDGAWLLVDWPSANQWLFLHGARVRAVANVAQQFPRPDRLGPVFQLDGGWCCTP